MSNHHDAAHEHSAAPHDHHSHEKSSHTHGHGHGHNHNHAHGSTNRKRLGIALSRDQVVQSPTSSGNSPFSGDVVVCCPARPPKGRTLRFDIL